MARSLRTLLLAAAGAFAIGACAGCSPASGGGSTSGCNATCPVGCNISTDCQSCIPTSQNAGQGTACQTNLDCCTGSCQNGVCAPSPSGTNGGSTGGSSGGAGSVAVGGTCSANGDCSSDYCKSNVCVCNVGGHNYPCKSAGDCCSGATCQGGVCQGGGSSGGSTGSKGGGSSGGSTGSAGGGCKTWTGTPNAGYDAACNPRGGTANVCDPTGVCGPNCTTQGASYCANGNVCNSDGHCLPPAPTSGGTSGGSTGHGSSGGSTGGGSTGGGSTGGGTSGGSSGGSTGACAAPDKSEFGACADAGTTPCGTGLSCVQDPMIGWACEYTCSTTANCVDLIAVCNGGHCAANLCGPIGAGGANVNGTYGEPCNGAATNDSVCLGQFQADGGSLGFGVCLQGGTLPTNSACNAFPTGRCDGASALCAGGNLCLSPDGGSPAGTCTLLCNTAANSCANGGTCNPGDGEEGICSTSGGSTGGSTSGGSTGGSTSGGSTGGSTSGGSSGGSTTGGSGGTCKVCAKDSDCGTGSLCYIDPNSAAGNTYCGPDCSSGQTCATTATCTQTTDADQITSVSVCYPKAGCSSTGGSSGGTSGGSGGNCGASADPSGSGASGASCSAASSCCSQYCNSGTCTCNDPVNPSTGQPFSCSTDTDCNPNANGVQSAGGLCQSGSCVFPCVSNSDCCAATSSVGCVSGFCQ